MTSHERKKASFLDDVRESCGTIVERSKHRNFSDLVSNGEFRDGIVLQLIFLGEAASHLSKKTRDLYPEAPWRSIIGLRNVLIHMYWTIDFLKIWKVVHEDVPELLKTLSR